MLLKVGLSKMLIFNFILPYVITQIFNCDAQIDIFMYSLKKTPENGFDGALGAMTPAPPSPIYRKVTSEVSVQPR